jgi:hypothetical protein
MHFLVPLQPPANADEPVRIDQQRALAGSVSPGDAPGFPVTISRGGHYRLTGDLSVPAGSIGVIIEADDVVLDLNGHSIRGPVRCAQNQATLAVRCDAASRPETSGIRSSAAKVVIRNGSVAGFSGTGLHLGAGGAAQDVHVHSNAGAGIVAIAPSGTAEVRDVRASNNAGAGIVCDRVHIVGSMFVANGGTGVDCRRAWFNASESHHNGGQGVAGGARFGLRSHGNRTRDDFGAGARPLKTSDADAQRRTRPPP